MSATARGILSAAIVVFVSILVSSASPQPAPRAPDGPIHITINAQEIEAFEPGNPSRIRFGPLEFRGGLELSSSYREFGGVSALRLFPDGEHFISLTDKGRWLRGRIAYQRGRPVAIEDVEMAPILGPDGRPLAARGWYDTESIAMDGGTLYVGIERVNRIVRFDYGRQGLLARGQPIPLPPGIASLPNNKGLECLEFVPTPMPGAGTLIAISERGLDSAGNIRGFLIGGPNPGEFSVVRHDDFEVSDCAILPDGALALLERRFTWTTGVAIRIRRVPLTEF
ncbi:MAG: esterase-like activity of phytase family protein, partial [Xanthobacteraceae bacterium]